MLLRTSRSLITSLFNILRMPSHQRAEHIGSLYRTIMKSLTLFGQCIMVETTAAYYRRLNENDVITIQLNPRLLLRVNACLLCTLIQVK
jgi:hypothetical protein